MGIIGIVAALTIPPLIQNYKKKQTSVKLKRFYSMMTQAIQLSEIDNGPALKWNKEAIAVNDDGTNDIETNRQLATDFYNTYLRNYIKTAKIVEASAETSTMMHVYLNDGSMFTVHNGACHAIRYHVNGYNANDIVGKDEFQFCVCNSKMNPVYHALTPNKAFGYGNSTAKPATREEALSLCKSNKTDCTLLLQVYDNWEFKDDYPYKL